MCTVCATRNGLLEVFEFNGYCESACRTKHTYTSIY